ncbi:probable transcriptional regulatory protein isoform X2 [Tanacetum coccineum]
MLCQRTISRFVEWTSFDDKLQFVDEPVEIMDREVKQLRRSRVLIFKEVNKARGARDTLVVVILEVNSIKDLVALHIWGKPEESVANVEQACAKFGKAKELDVPKDILERNIKRASDKGQETYIEKLYEVYGYAGTELCGW